MNYDKELQTLALKASSIVNHIRNVRDYRVDYYGKLKDGTEIIVPKQSEVRPTRGEVATECWDFHVESHVLECLGYYDLERSNPNYIDIPF